MTERQLDDRPIEFPTTNERLAPRDRRRFFAAENAPVLLGPTSSALIAYEDGVEHSRYEHPSGSVGGEGLFVANPDDPSDDAGWVLTYRHYADTTELVVFTAADLSVGPIAEVEIPHRVPFGFHAKWHQISS